MEVTSTKTISFPSLGWGIAKGEARELPDDPEAQEIIKAHPAINAGGATPKVDDAPEEDTTPDEESDE